MSSSVAPAFDVDIARSGRAHHAFTALATIPNMERMPVAILSCHCWPSVLVTAGEWIFAPANTFHLIEVLEEQPAIHIPISHTGEYLRHEWVDAPPTPPGALQ